MISFCRTFTFGRSLLCVLMLGVCSLGFTSPGNAKEPPQEKPQPAKAAPADAPTVQIALLLDTSNSMDGLIDQAKTQLWKVVGEFAKTELGGKLPNLQVALYEYGNDGLPATEGYIRQVSPMTDDLDKISESLFALKTNGGEEYCGYVIRTAVNQLTWSKGKRDLRCIFIAGNEPFTQGSVDFRASCKLAADKGITISTIFCGDREQGVRTNWENGAKLAEGSYLCINQDHKAKPIPAPQDNEIAKLSAELNKTYIPFGDDATREKFLKRQVAQDENASKAALSAAVSRAGFKASGLYKNSSWDLVDAVTEGKVKLEEVDEKSLPEGLRKLSPKDRSAYIVDAAAKRKEIAARIKTLSSQRGKFIAEERARLAPEEAAAAAEPFADAVQSAIQSQSPQK